MPNLHLKQTTETDYITQNKKVILESILLIKKKKKTKSKKAEEEKEKVIFTGDTSKYRVTKIESRYFIIHTVTSDSGESWVQTHECRSSGERCSESECTAH